jgi:Flp pilus assembly pilin Flp
MKNRRSFSQLALFALLHIGSTGPRSRRRDDRGQTTAEYALVLLGAAGIAVLLVGWATKSGAIGALFDAVLDGVVGRVK